MPGYMPAARASCTDAPNAAVKYSYYASKCSRSMASDNYEQEPVHA